MRLRDGIRGEGDYRIRSRIVKSEGQSTFDVNTRMRERVGKPCVEAEINLELSEKAAIRSFLCVYSSLFSVLIYSLLRLILTIWQNFEEIFVNFKSLFPLTLKMLLLERKIKNGIYEYTFSRSKSFI